MNLLKLVKQLYTTGRAFRIPYGSLIENLHVAINEVMQTALDNVRNIYNQLLPDNPNFTEADAVIWERRLGLPGLGNFDERKLAISRRLNYPGNTLGRMSLVYFQAQLRQAGFNVFVHENNFDNGNPIDPGTGVGSYTEFGLGEYGNDEYGTTGFPFDSIVANHDDKTREIIPNYTADQLRFTFFIGEQNFPNAAGVPARREQEFRKLILTLKPQHMVCYLLVNYN